jgi:hypothetical protein
VRKSDKRSARCGIEIALDRTAVVCQSTVRIDCFRAQPRHPLEEILAGQWVLEGKVSSDCCPQPTVVGSAAQANDPLGLSKSFSPLFAQSIHGDGVVVADGDIVVID